MPVYSSCVIAYVLLYQYNGYPFVIGALLSVSF